MDSFWINDPNIIIRDYYEIIPINSMSRIKQMNTASRFLIYFLILSIIFDAKSNILLFALIALLLIVAFYFIYKTDLIGVQNDLISENKDEIEKFDKKDKNKLVKKISEISKNKKIKNKKCMKKQYYKLNKN